MVNQQFSTAENSALKLLHTDVDFVTRDGPISF